jgi:16S rRNA (uracil1498-N3)-methyltransferase
VAEPADSTTGRESHSRGARFNVRSIKKPLVNVYGSKEARMTAAAKAPRLYVDVALAPGAAVPLDRGQTNYLGNVLRLKAGDKVLVFNGRDGEWLTAVEPVGRKALLLVVQSQTRPQTPHGKVHYLFAPLKQARLDYVVQKAVEMGTAAITPVLTRRTQVARLNRDRLQANMIEAAEQCGILAMPRLMPEARLAAALEALPSGWLLVFCDEEAPEGDPIAALRAAGEPPGITVLIGPEGGFDEEERRLLLARTDVLRLSLGPRILRADTAAVAALALVQGVLGDWRRAV